MLDLFAGKLGWAKAFVARGWDVMAIDLVEPDELPNGCEFIKANVLHLGFAFGNLVLSTDDYRDFGPFDFICASSPCEQFSGHGMKHFHPNPPYPELGIKLFSHTRSICEASGVPYIMENVRAAQQFVGKAANYCGPFYLWGTGVPPLVPAGIRKGIDTGGSVANRGLSREEISAYRRKHDPMWSNSKSKKRQEATAKAATIPPELANCVADYAERILETNQQQAPGL